MACNPFEIRAWVFPKETWDSIHLDGLNPFEIRAWVFLRLRKAGGIELCLNPFEIRAWVFPMRVNNNTVVLCLNPFEIRAWVFLKALIKQRGEASLNPFEIRAWVFLITLFFPRKINRLHGALRKTGGVLQVTSFFVSQEQAKRHFPGNINPDPLFRLNELFDYHSAGIPLHCIPSGSAGRPMRALSPRPGSG